MTTLTTTPSTTSNVSTAPFRRTWAIAEMEMKILWRNKTALFMAVFMAPVIILASAPMLDGLDPKALSGQIIVSLAGLALLFGSYYNLTTLAVARREERMLKRLTAGEVARSELLTGMAVPHALIAFFQVALVALVMSLVVAAPEFADPFLAFLAFFAGAVVSSALAFAISGVTRTVESAQLSTMPILLVAAGLGGMAIPLTLLPDSIQRVAELTPFAPVTQLLHLGISGIGPDGNPAVVEAATAGRPLLVLIAWLLISAFLSRRFMRWDARR